MRVCRSPGRWSFLERLPRRLSADGSILLLPGLRSDPKKNRAALKATRLSFLLKTRGFPSPSHGGFGFSQVFASLKRCIRKVKYFLLKLDYFKIYFPCLKSLPGKIIATRRPQTPQGALRMDGGDRPASPGGEAGSGGLPAKRRLLTRNFASLRGPKPSPGGISTGGLERRRVFMAKRRFFIRPDSIK